MRISFGRPPALLLAAPALLALLGTRLQGQDTTRSAPPPPTASRIAARLLVVFRPPVRGVRRERALTRGGDGARALIPDARVDTLVPQTLRDTPHVAVCAAGEPDSARLTVRITDSTTSTSADGITYGAASGTSRSVMIGLRAGLNRIALASTGLTLPDGALAEWSLSTRSGEVFLQEFIQRHVVRSTPTINALATNGIWYDALDLFVVEALHGVPLASERLDAFLTSVGAMPCAEPPAKP